MTALLAVYALEDRLLLELPPSLTEKTLQALDKFLISEKAVFEAADEAFTVLAVQGPARSGAAGDARRADTATRRPMHHVEIADRRRAGPGGQSRRGPWPGFHCWTAATHGAVLWRALVADGARPVGVRGARTSCGSRPACPGTARTWTTRSSCPRRRSSRSSLHQGLLHRPGGRGARQVPRPRQPALSGPRPRRRPRARPRARRSLADGKEVGRVTSAVRSPRAGPAHRARLPPPRALRARAPPWRSGSATR